MTYQQTFLPANNTMQSSLSNSTLPLQDGNYNRALAKAAEHLRKTIAEKDNVIAVMFGNWSKNYSYADCQKVLDAYVKMVISNPEAPHFIYHKSIEQQLLTLAKAIEKNTGTHYKFVWRMLAVLNNETIVNKNLDRTILYARESYKNKRIDPYIDSGIIKLFKDLWTFASGVVSKSAAMVSTTVDALNKTIEGTGNAASFLGGIGIPVLIGGIVIIGGTLAYKNGSDLIGAFKK